MTTLHTKRFLLSLSKKPLLALGLPILFWYILLSATASKATIQCPERNFQYKYIITGSETDDKIAGNGNDTIRGLAGNDSLDGCMGDDRLEGGLGNDTLKGSDGSDSFVFNTQLGPNNIDVINDFNASSDKIVLDRKIFNLPLHDDGDPTRLVRSAFGQSNRALTPDQRILFDPAKRHLFYDSDGDGKKEEPRLIATISGEEPINDKSFLLDGKPELTFVDKMGILISQQITTILLLTLIAISLLLLFGVDSLIKDNKLKRQRDENPRRSDSRPQGSDSIVSSLNEIQTSIDDLSSQVTKAFRNVPSTLNHIQHDIKRIDESLLKKPAPLPPPPPPPPPSPYPAPNPEPSPKTFSPQTSVVSVAEPDETLADLYQDLFLRDDRTALFKLSMAELNITAASEETLTRGTILAATQLEVVNGGGSYLLIQRDSRNWLVPTFQTMKSFETTQPAKGLFTFVRHTISAPTLRRTAEVKQAGGLWEVINMGVVAVPH